MIPAGTVSFKRMDDPDAEWEGPFECTSFEITDLPGAISRIRGSAEFQDALENHPTIKAAAANHVFHTGETVSLEGRRFVVTSLTAPRAGKRVAQWKQEQRRFKR